MDDPYFDKPPRGTLVSDASVRWLCSTAVVLMFGLLFHLHPETGGEMKDLAMLVLVLGGGGWLFFKIIALAF